jgi:hypothetical protein
VYPILVHPVSLAQVCEHIEDSTDFSFKTHFSQFFLNFQQQNPFKNQYMSHLSSENCERNFIKPDSPRAFQNTKKHPQISTHFSVSILFSFHWENGSIINSFHNHSSKQSQTKSMHHYSLRAFSRYRESSMKHCGLGDLNMTKQNKLPSFIRSLPKVLIFSPIFLGQWGNITF